VAKGTIEEKILQRAQQKSEVESRLATFINNAFCLAFFNRFKIWSSLEELIRPDLNRKPMKLSHFFWVIRTWKKNACLYFTIFYEYAPIYFTINSQKAEGEHEATRA
jgi:hypothetical protein